MNTQLAKKHRFSLLKSEQKTRGANTRVAVGSITPVAQQTTPLTLLSCPSNSKGQSENETDR